jgi:hypothetical protein
MEGVLSVTRSSQLPEEAQADARTLHALGAVGTIILSAATNAERLFEDTEFIPEAFKNGKILLFKLPEYDTSLAVRLTRSASTEYVFGKTSEILA